MGRSTRNAALQVKDLLQIDAEDEDESEGSEAGGAGERERGPSLSPIYGSWKASTGSTTRYTGSKKEYT